MGGDKMRRIGVLRILALSVTLILALGGMCDTNDEETSDTNDEETSDTGDPPKADAPE